MNIDLSKKNVSSYHKFVIFQTSTNNRIEKKTKFVAKKHPLSHLLIFLSITHCTSVLYLFQTSENLLSFSIAIESENADLKIDKK